MNFPPSYKLLKSVSYLDHDFSIITQTFPKWLYESCQYELSQQFNRFPEPDVDQNTLSSFSNRCYLMAPGITHVLALFDSLSDDQMTEISTIDKKDFHRPIRHWDMNNIVNGFHEQDSPLEELIEMMLINPSFWIFQGGKLERCRLISHSGMVSLLERYSENNILSVVDY